MPEATGEYGAICEGAVAVYFDSDTHVDECDDTWANMSEPMKALTPVTVFLDKETLPPYIRPGYDRCWFIDGQLHNRQIRSDERTGTTVEIRELYDVPARLADMDSLNVGIQVLYPTLFLNELSEHPLLAVALCQSYNRWLAERCAESNGRIQWVAMMPLVDMEATLAEMRWAKEHGAVGVHKRAQEVQNRLPADRYFAPFYAQALELDLPICMHTGQAWAPTNNHLAMLNTPGAATLLSAFSSVVGGKLPSKFPGLRFAFIEAGAGWVPYALWMQRASTTLNSFDNRSALDPEAVLRAAEVQRGILTELNIWVTCETSEDISYLIDVLGDDQLIVGSDYGHPDRASIRDAHGLMYKIPGVKESSADKLTSLNAANFYGVPAI